MPRKYTPNTYRIAGEIAYMQIADRAGKVIAEAIVDADRVADLRLYRWSLATTGYVTCSRVIGGRNVQLLLHRYLTGAVKGDGLEVDHRDRNRLNNCRANLRIVTTAQNNKNRAIPPTSQHTGVSWCKRTGRWQAHIYQGSKSIGLGRFDTEQEALAAIARASGSTL